MEAAKGLDEVFYFDGILVALRSGFQLLDGRRIEDVPEGGENFVRCTDTPDTTFRKESYTLTFPYFIQIGR